MNTAFLKERLDRLDEMFSAGSVTEHRKARALVLDLSDETSYDWEVPDRYTDCYVSGPALGARIWAEFAGADVEESSTYESNNPIVVTSSYLANSAVPGCESVCLTFRSPVTGSLCFNVVSNTVGMRLGALGYQAMIIIGRLRRPAVIDVRKSGVRYNISEVFIGFNVSQVEDLVGVGPMTTAMSIGPAGEQKVPYAAVICEGASTGLGGLGCVFGYKNIKSLCITGFDTEIRRSGDELAAEKAVADYRSLLSSSPYCKAMQRCGSAVLIKYSSRDGWAPVFNFERRTDPRLFHLGGEEVNRRYGDEHGGCIGCPVMCRHRTHDGIVIPGYEAILMLGSNLACFDMDKIIERYAQCLDMGLDPVSTGNVLGWTISACSSGLMNMFEPDFSFKDNSKVLPLIEMIAKRLGPGEPLSFGTYALGKACGDESFAYTIRGLECGPYDYRGAYAQSLSDSMGFWFPNYFEIHSRVCTAHHEEWAVLNERIVMGLESYGLSASIMVPAVIEASRKLRKKVRIIPNSDIKNVRLDVPSKLITAVTGVETQGDDILALGDRCWRLIYEINRALGFNMLEDAESRLPEHFFIDPDSNHEKPSIVPFRSLIDRYCFLRKQIIAAQGSDFS